MWQQRLRPLPCSISSKMGMRSGMVLGTEFEYVKPGLELVRLTANTTPAVAPSICEPSVLQHQWSAGGSFHTLLIIT